MSLKIRGIEDSASILRVKIFLNLIAGTKKAATRQTPNTYAFIIECGKIPLAIMAIATRTLGSAKGRIFFTFISFMLVLIIIFAMTRNNNDIMGGRISIG